MLLRVHCRDVSKGIKKRSSVFLNVEACEQAQTKRSWSDKQLSRESGVSVRSIGNYKGGAPMRLDMLGALAKALDLDPEKLRRDTPAENQTTLDEGEEGLFAREDDLSEVRRMMDTNPVVGLVGEPQVGKTTLRRALAARYRRDGHRVFELENSRTSNPLNFTQFRDRLESFLHSRSPGQEARSKPKKLEFDLEVEELLATLEDSRAILFIDDCQFVEDPQVRVFLFEQLPRRASDFHVLLLSRSRSSLQIPGTPEFPIYALQGWSPDECDDYYKEGGVELDESARDFVLGLTHQLPGTSRLVRGLLKTQDKAAVLRELKQGWRKDAPPSSSVSQAIDFLSKVVLRHMTREEKEAVVALSVLDEPVPRGAAQELIGESSEEILTSLAGNVLDDSNGQVKILDSVADFTTKYTEDLRRYHLNAAEYYSRLVASVDDLLSLHYPGHVKSMYTHYSKAGRPTRGRAKLREQLLRWIEELNTIRNYTRDERAELAEVGGTDRMRRTLDICFRVVETFEPRHVVLDELLGLISADHSNLVRAQPMYFILMANLHVKGMEHVHWLDLLKRLRDDEPNPHVIFHILQALKVCVAEGAAGFGSDEWGKGLLKTTTEVLTGFLKSELPCKDRLVVLYSRFIAESHPELGIVIPEYTPSIEDFVSKDLLRFDELLSKVDGFAEIPDAATRLVENSPNERCWEQVEMTLFTAGDLGTSLIDPEVSLDCLQKALISEFWIVQWWAISNLGKVPDFKAIDILVRTIQGAIDGAVPILDLGFLSLRSLEQLHSRAAQKHTREIQERIERELDRVRSRFSDTNNALCIEIDDTLRGWNRDHRRS